MLWLCGLLAVAVVAMAAEPEWWTTAVLYQVYPRSFKDSNGDGVGDLKGITEKADYLKEIGVTAIWISPIFKSPMADFGYDISDYRSIDPIFGTMEDFQELLEKLKSLDIKLLLDLVPNHSSDQHEWFQKSVQKIEPYTDYYVWSDGKIDPETKKRVPPNNWISVFSGPAWEWNEQRQQFYLHHFVKEQPDLNYTNPAVLKEMDDVIKFWLDTGVDGFRVDAVPFLVEDEEMRDEPPLEGKAGVVFSELDHRYTQNLPGTYEILKHWAELVYSEYVAKDGKPRAFFVEAYADLPTTMKYYGTGTLSLMQPFNFQLLTSGNQSTRPETLKDLIMGWLDHMPSDGMGSATLGGVANWVIGNHDQGRIADRYGPETVDAMNLLTGVLPGVKVVYNGEEIGMRDTFIRWDQTVDPSGRNLGPDHYLEGTRDPERTPMQWDNTVSAGFSANNKTWLPVNPNYWWLNVEAQRKANTSHLKVFQDMVKARKDPVFVKGEVKVKVPNEDTLLVFRSLENSYYVFVFNMGSEIAEYSSEDFFSPEGLDMDFVVVAASINTDIKKGVRLPRGTPLGLRPRAAILLKSVSVAPASASAPLGVHVILIAGVVSVGNLLRISSN